mgnify:CR=1 FL=1
MSAVGVTREGVVDLPDKTICIDPGHGGTDPGAVFGAVHEADIVLSISLYLAAFLRGRGIGVLETRQRNETVSLADRVRVANSGAADRYISIHVNSFADPRANGVETVVSRHASEATIGWAQALHRRLIQDCPGRADRGVREDFAERGGDMYVLKNTRMPAVLVELGFLSHAEDRAWITSVETHRRLATALADGALLAWEG